MSKHGADLVFWSTHSGSVDPGKAIATLKDGKMTIVDPKLKAIINSGASTKLMKRRGMYVIDCGFLNGDRESVEVSNLSESYVDATNERQSATESKDNARASRTSPMLSESHTEATGAEQRPYYLTIPCQENRWTVNGVQHMLPSTPAMMSAYLEAAKRG